MKNATGYLNKYDYLNKYKVDSINVNVKLNTSQQNDKEKSNFVLDFFMTSIYDKCKLMYELKNEHKVKTK